jgi:predicted NAD-dependent protein-ADP-ribosyltransferase YbiA (DUF1768 family)
MDKHGNKFIWWRSCLVESGHVITYFKAYREFNVFLEAYQSPILIEGKSFNMTNKYAWCRRQPESFDGSTLTFAIPAIDSIVTG